MARSSSCPTPRSIGIRVAALLHDVGKVAVPEEILDKPSALTSAEWRTVVQHPRIGQVILEQAAALKDAVPIILHHHERYAGHGYPYGLRANEIPLGARIVAIADAYDAMVHDRPYKRAMTHDAGDRGAAPARRDPVRSRARRACSATSTRSTAPQPDPTVLAMTGRGASVGDRRAGPASAGSRASSAGDPRGPRSRGPSRVRHHGVRIGRRMELDDADLSPQRAPDVVDPARDPPRHSPTHGRRRRLTRARRDRLAPDASAVPRRYAPGEDRSPAWPRPPGQSAGPADPPSVMGPAAGAGDLAPPRRDSRRRRRVGIRRGRPTGKEIGP